jgi:hypothetical protein
MIEPIKEPPKYETNVIRDLAWAFSIMGAFLTILALVDHYK